MYNSTVLYLLDGSGQLHAPTASPPEKESLLYTIYEALWIPEPVWTLWRRKLLPLPRIEPRFLGRPARNLFAILAQSQIVDT
jgi:hypothetical protein